MTDFFSQKEVQALIDADDQAIKLFAEKLRSKIEKQLTKAVSNLENAKSIAALLLELNKLSTANLPKEVKKELNQYIDLYQKSIKDVGERIKQTTSITKVFNSNDIRIVNELYDFSQAKIISSVNETYVQFKTSVAQSYIVGSLPSVDEVISSLGSSLSSKLETEVNTQLAGIQNTLTIKKAEELELTHFLYSGGLIKTSREFCSQRAGNIYTFAEAKTWDNEQGLPVIPYLGGYNCRHAIVPMTKDRAIEEGWTA